MWVLCCTTECIRGLCTEFTTGNQICWKHVYSLLMDGNILKSIVCYYLRWHSSYNMLQSNTTLYAILTKCAHSFGFKFLITTAGLFCHLETSFALQEKIIGEKSRGNNWNVNFPCSVWLQRTVRQAGRFVGPNMAHMCWWDTPGSRYFKLACNIPEASISPIWQVLIMDIFL